MSRSYSYPDLVYRFDVDRLPWEVKVIRIVVRLLI